MNDLYGQEVRDRENAQHAQTLQTNAWNEYVPAIPLAYYFGFIRRRFQCKCGQSFYSVRRYREHYAYVHILGYEKK